MNAPRLDGLDSDASRQVMAAAQALAIGRADQAEDQLAPAWKRYREHPEVLRLHAGIASLRGRHADAIASMRRAVELRPQDPLYHNTLGTVLGASGDFDNAISALQRACELQPGLGIAWFNLGVMLTRCVRTDEAAQALQHAVHIDPDNVDARSLLADLLRMKGDADAATAEYRKVLHERPWAGMAWWGLADLRTGALAPDDIERMRAALRDSRVGDDDRIAIGFALAHGLDDGGRYEDALSALKNANAIARLRLHWSAPAFADTANTIGAAFTPPQVEDAEGSLGRGVVFIVGMPRSGTTLVEQVLASHSQVEGAGELPDLPLVIDEESRRRNRRFPQWVADATPDDWQRLGYRYLERTAYWRRRRPISTDKFPGNWLYIGAIRAMLPSAHIVICRRDPLETCFSCYRQLLPQGNEWSRTPEDLGAFWRSFDRLIARWTSLYPTHTYQHIYEALLDQPALAIRNLLNACGLPFEESCLRFHETRRGVRSPSATQVRRTLQTDTRHTPKYGDLLDPLRVSLGLPVFGHAE